VINGTSPGQQIFTQTSLHDPGRDFFLASEYWPFPAKMSGHFVGVMNTAAATPVQDDCLTQAFLRKTSEATTEVCVQAKLTCKKKGMCVVEAKDENKNIYTIFRPMGASQAL
jgi:hypothetical protein